MRYRICSFTLLVGLIVCGAANEMLAQKQNSSSISMNRIEGRITDESNNGINDVYVELYDSFGAMIGRQRSTGQGRFTFQGMGPGRYTISVKPFGTNFKEDSKEIEITNLISQMDTEVVDFRLRIDKRFRNEDTGIVGTIYAQEVPDDARRLYESSIQLFDSDPEKAIVDLENAVKLFPSYFNALAALGKANIVRGKFATGYPYLLRAIDVNNRCADCYYCLALAFYKMNQIPAATKAIEATVLLQPQVASASLLQGIIYRSDNKLAKAEKALLTANSLFKTANPDVHWQLSLVYNRLNRNQDAANELEQYLKTKPHLSNAEKESVRQLISKLRRANSGVQPKSFNFLNIIQKVE